MKFEYRRPELEQALMAANTLDALEAALQGVAGLMPDLSDPAIRGHQMFSVGLDSTVPHIARRLGLTDVPLEKNNDNVCIVATQLYAHGGHSKVAYDISQLLGADRVTAVLTDVYGRLRHRYAIGARKPNSPLKRRADVILGAGTHVEKISELYNILAAMRPSRIFMLTHHFDMVAPIALWPFRSVVEYLHHADHLPTLGATVPFSAHVDLTYRCHLACQEAGLSPIYAGMTVMGARSGPAAKPRATPGRLRIATCGSILKYRGAVSHRWADYAVAALREPGAELIHIGPVDDAFRAEMAAALTNAGLDPQGYIFAGPVDDLAAELQAREVDAYLSSYPESGGKANLEAMSVGLAPIVPVDPNSPELLQFNFPAPTWVKINAPSKLPAARRQSQALGREPALGDVRKAIRDELARFEDYVSGRKEPPRAGPR